MFDSPTALMTASASKASREPAAIRRNRATPRKASSGQSCRRGRVPPRSARAISLDALRATTTFERRPLARQGRSSDLGVCRSESFAVNGFLRWSSWYSPANDGTFRQRDAEPRPVVAEEDSLAADPAAEAVSQRLFPSVRTAPGI